ncbi:hypothetical protein IT575_08715 [bacterium]|nr:hypothetical protein [bacterium]
MEGLGSFDRENRRIAFVWGMLGVLVLLGFFANSAESRWRYSQGQRVRMLVLSLEQHRRMQDEYKLVEASAPLDSPASHVMPGDSLFYNHQPGDVIEVLMLPGTIKVQSADGLEYWSGRTEVNWLMALLLAALVTSIWIWLRQPARA